MTWIVASLLAATAQDAQGARAPPAAIACPTSAVCRRVTDQAGQPLALVEISVERSGTPQIVEVSGDDGTFVVPRSALTASSRVLLSAPGYETLGLTAQQFGESGPDLVLNKVGGQTGGEIVVTARQVSTPFATKVVNQLSLLTDPSANADVLLAVAAVPGATGLNNSVDIQLRGGAIGLSRIYFNDIPLYEVVRGSAVDQVTRVSSILNPSIVKNIEVYSTNPPAFLANSAAGAVRVLPNTVATGAGSLFVGLPGASYTTSRKLGDGGAAQLYATAADLRALLAVTPGLRETTKRFQSAGVGGSFSIPFGEDAELTALTLADAESGEYPLRLLNLSGTSLSKRRRIYAAMNVEVPVPTGRIKADFAFTDIRNRFAFLDFDAVADNRYLYASLEHADRVGAFDYRAGLAGEQISLLTNGSLLFYGDGAGAPPWGRLERTARYASFYGFATYSASPQVSLALGSRQFVGDRPRQSPVYSAAATWRSKDERHRVVAAAGTFSAIVPPEIGTVNGVTAARSRQASLDYAFKGDDFALELGAYVKSDRVAELTTRIEGADLSATFRLRRDIELELILATSRQRVGTERAANDLPLLFRITTRVSLSPTAQFNARFTTKSGAVYFRLDKVALTPGGDLFPIFETPVNRRRLPSFQVLDLTLQERFRQWPGKQKPFVFVSLSNALNRRNQARVVYSADYGEEERAYFEPRALTFGLVVPI